jgi:hypothetical protein
MSDAPKITRGIRLPKVTLEETEARESQRTNPLADIKAAADAYMRPVHERAREAMDAALAVQRLTIPDALMVTPEERERKDKERRLNEAFEASRRNDESVRRRIQQDRAQFIRDMAEANAAALLKAQGQGEPAPMPATSAQDEPDKPSRQRKDCLRDAMESAFDALEAELGRAPNDSEIRAYLKNRDTSGYIAGASDNLIFWLDWAGNKKTASKRNISDRLDNIIKSRKG